MLLASWWWWCTFESSSIVRNSQTLLTAISWDGFLCLFELESQVWASGYHAWPNCAQKTWSDGPSSSIWFYIFSLHHICMCSPGGCVGAFNYKVHVSVTVTFNHHQWHVDMLLSINSIEVINRHQTYPASTPTVSFNVYMSSTHWLRWSSLRNYRNLLERWG